MLTSVKKYDAVVPIHLWNRRISDIFPSMTDKQIDSLRSVVLSWSKQKFFREIKHFFKKYHSKDYFRYLRLHQYNVGGSKKGQENSTEAFSPNFLQDLEASRSVLTAYSNSTFFEWSKGSTLLFWRWPTPYRDMAMEGLRPYYVDN